MSTRAKVFMNGRSQAIRLPKEFRVAGNVVSLTRVSGGILIREGDPWEGFEEASRELGDDFLTTMERRDRKTPQKRNFTAGIR